MVDDKRQIKIETPSPREAVSVTPEQPEQQTAKETVESAPPAEGAAMEQETRQQQEPAQESQRTSALQPTAVAAHAPAFDRLEKEIEGVLEEGLTDLYLALPADQKAAFKQKGEEVRGAIRKLVDAAKVNSKKIFKLIREWLKMIPGVNRFFLEQEAKIKTDKILFISKEEKNR